MEKLEYNLHQPTVLSHLFLIWNLDIYPVIVYRVTESPSDIFAPSPAPNMKFLVRKGLRWLPGQKNVQFVWPACLTDWLTDTIDQANSYLEYH